MALQRLSACKVNFLLNILGKRADGYHELETLMHPVPIFDRMTFGKKAASGITLTCNHPALPTDSGNLVYRAAELFLRESAVREGVTIHLEKRIPLAAGLGGGSGNAACTLLGLNDLFGQPLHEKDLYRLAASLGSDIPFFLQSNPALAVGRGEQVESLPPFRLLNGDYIMLVHPGFGVSTAWAYKNLARFPAALNGRAGRARELVSELSQGGAARASAKFYNSLEAPVLEKFPLLAIFQEFLRENGATVALMSGSGSSTFALYPDLQSCEKAIESFRAKFGNFCWIASAPLSQRAG